MNGCGPDGRGSPGCSAEQAFCGGLKPSGLTRSSLRQLGGANRHRVGSAVRRGERTAGGGNRQQGGGQPLVFLGEMRASPTTASRRSLRTEAVAETRWRASQWVGFDEGGADGPDSRRGASEGVAVELGEVVGGRDQAPFGARGRRSSSVRAAHLADCVWCERTLARVCERVR